MAKIEGIDFPTIKTVKFSKLQTTTLNRDILKSHVTTMEGSIREFGFMDVIKVFPDKRDALIDYLKDKNIHTSVHYRPLHLFTQFRDESIFPVADKEWLKMITLPVHLNMTDKDIDYVIYWVKEFFSNFINLNLSLKL